MDINFSLIAQPVHSCFLSFASKEAKRISELFIHSLSSNEFPEIGSRKVESFLSEERKVSLIKQLTPDVRVKLRAKEHPEGTSFYKVGSGSHYVVWGHPEYPEIVLKFMDQESAIQQQRVAQRAFEVTKTFLQSWVHIPFSTVITLDATSSVYVEEKLPLSLNYDQHKEFWARILTHYQSDKASETFKANLGLLITQIQSLVEKVGFWDVGYHNLPEVRVDGKGVCGTDFENIDENLSNLDEGLERLMNLVPVSPLVDNLSKIYQETIFPKEYQRKLEGIKKFNSMMASYKDSKPLAIDEETFKKQCNILWQEKIEELNALQQALIHYDQIEIQQKESSSLSDADCLVELKAEEKSIALELIQKMKCQLKSIASASTITKKRCLFFQGSHFSNGLYRHEDITGVLSILKAKGIVISWNDDSKYKIHTEQDLTYCSYYVYF